MAIWWLIFNLISIVFSAFFSMSEMACVSFNRVRLHYYVSKGKHQAIWLNTLLQNPSMLFGTTLIGNNVANILGSECSREFHEAIGLSPDLAPLTQVMLVVVFGELAPMFAARRYAEHMALLCVPILYGTALFLKPILWVINYISELCHWLIGGKGEKSSIYLTEEELQKILEEQDEEVPSGLDSEEFNAISSNIFRLGDKTAKDVQIPLSKVPMLPSHATVGQLRNLLKNSEAEYVPVYHHHDDNIIGIAYPRNLIQFEGGEPLKNHLKAPWFVTKDTLTIPILKQFRSNNQNVAIILNRQGNATGIVDIEDLLKEIFGKLLPSHTLIRSRIPVINKTVAADTNVKAFEKQYGVNLYPDGEITLGELLTLLLKRHPEKGDSVQTQAFELTVKETTIREIKTIHIRSLR